MDSTLLSLILPEGLSEYFELDKVETVSDSYYIYLKERNIQPKEFTAQKLISKGFFEEISVRDFPLRGKPCFLKLKRRKWMIVETGEIVFRDWNLVAEGTKMTQEFAFFLRDYLDSSPISCKTLGRFFGVEGKRLQEQYVSHLSDFMSWDQAEHAQDWLLFPDNLGEYLSIDETSLSQGELYTIVTNKAAKGKKGALVAIVKGTESETVIKVLCRIKEWARKKVKEVTLDLAPTMAKIVRRSFPKAKLVSDRFHVQQLASEAVQEIRIKHRWDAIEQENKEMDLAKEIKKPWIPELLENGDTLKQLLARSRYLLFKKEVNWTSSQNHRAELLFKRYPDLQKAYEISQELSSIFSRSKDRRIAFKKLAIWYNKIEKLGYKPFNTIARTIQNNYETILNYFDNRSTNASAESFNAKIKAFRSQFRGVRNVKFFLFRLAKIYA
ncbi:ISAon1 family transposase [Pedobacter aquae]|uniref:ISAon1 family transposase n=1 Tax=Pedobacter aquae TaxID=2605747 RepID=UPI001F0A22B9